MNYNINVYKLTRELAKTFKYQTLYSQAKEIGLELFGNRNNFTDSQILFLNYLSFYAALNLDIAMGDVDEIVLENTIYEDAYSYFKRKERSEDKKQLDAKDGSSKEKNLSGNSDTWVFKSKKGK